MLSNKNIILQDSNVYGLGSKDLR